MEKIQIIETTINHDLLPKSLYGDKPYRVDGKGLIIPHSFKHEIEKLLNKFLATRLFDKQGVFLRLDLFIDPELDRIHLLEINSRLVDGWGASFNIIRAAGEKVEELSVVASRALFPPFWYLPLSNRVYRNDFDFVLRELNLLGVSVLEAKTLGDIPPSEWVYYYGWDRPKNNRPRLAPSSGYEIENKVHLADFSQTWHGDQVRIPRGYSRGNTVWDDIPREQVIFKFCEKQCPDSRRAGSNVLYPKEVGRGRFTKQCYNRGTIVAQDIVSSLEFEDRICQLVLLTSGETVITGYVLWAPRMARVITDAYEHGPLLWT
ncbi:MAG: hypothetical protein ABIB04_02945 [Patescibacteria group bacterium]